MTEVLPEEPLSLLALLDESLKQARRHFRAVYWPVALPLAFVGALTPLAQPLWLNAVQYGPGTSLPAMFAAMVVIWAVVLLFIFLYGLGYAALQAGATAATAGQPVAMGRAWAFTVRPAVLGTLLLAAVSTLLGTMCCILPGIYVGLLLSVIVPVMAEEARFGAGAFRRSYELLTYNPRRAWGADPRIKAFLVLVAGTLLGYGLSFAVQLPVLVVQQVLMARSIAAGQQLDPAQLMSRLVWLQVPSTFFGTLVQTAVYLYMAFGLALLYFDVRRRKEGADLEAAVARLAPGDASAS